MPTNRSTITLLQQKLINCVDEAIELFNRSEKYLIKHDVSERCICSKFAVYLEKVIDRSEFSEYDVDVEYNRGNNGNEYAAKKLHGRNIVVDLIVHRRGHNPLLGFDNLICIEMKKKGSNRRDIDADEERLDILTQNEYGFCYKVGFMIIIENNLHTKTHRLLVRSRFLNNEP